MCKIAPFIFLLLFLPKLFAEQTANPKLDSCILLYEDGKYGEAQDSLKALLPRLEARNDIAECYKYLAFTSVMMDMIETARKNFKNALLEYPDMTLDTVSVSPNIVVVFNQVKTEREIKQGHRAAIVAGGVLGLACAGAGAYFISAGGDSYRNYQDAGNRDDIVNYRNETETNYLIGRISLCAAAGAFGFSVYKFITRPKEK